MVAAVATWPRHLPELVAVAWVRRWELARFRECERWVASKQHDPEPGDVGRSPEPPLAASLKR